jgi:hypothetical protein
MRFMQAYRAVSHRLRATAWGNDDNQHAIAKLVMGILFDSVNNNFSEKKLIDLR